MSTAASLDMPILNGPYDPPGRFFNGYGDEVMTIYEVPAP